MPNIKIANSDDEILACHTVMNDLRPGFTKETFLAQVRRQEHQGYQLAYLQSNDEYVAVAGFRIGESLAWGRYIYVDDLVTSSSSRSLGHGAAIINWLCAYAQENGCKQIHLDSGTQRNATHRFYLREGFDIAAFHFVKGV